MINGQLIEGEKIALIDRHELLVQIAEESNNQFLVQHCLQLLWQLTPTLIAAMLIEQHFKVADLSSMPEEYQKLES